MEVNFYTLVAVHALIIGGLYAFAYLMSERIRAKKLAEAKHD